MAIKDNIKKHRELAKLSQPQLAKLCGWESQSRVSNYETGIRAPSTEDLMQIAKALGIGVIKLIEDDEHQLRDLSSNYEIQLADQKVTSIPILDMIQAGAFREAFEDLENAEYTTTDAKVKAHTYALRVTGDSMIPIFQPGMIVIVEPDMPAVVGDYVIAKNGENEATLKQLVKDGADWYLKPLNPQYPTKSANHVNIVGVVIQVQSVTKFK